MYVIIASDASRSLNCVLDHVLGLGFSVSENPCMSELRKWLRVKAVSEKGDSFN